MRLACCSARGVDLGSQSLLRAQPSGESCASLRGAVVAETRLSAGSAVTEYLELGHRAGEKVAGPDGAAVCQCRAQSARQREAGEKHNR